LKQDIQIGHTNMHTGHTNWYIEERLSHNNVSIDLMSFVFLHVC